MALTRLKSIEALRYCAPGEWGKLLGLDRIPEEYLPDIQASLVLYKRISSAETLADLHDLQVEMIDRFGLLPGPVKTLFNVTELKQQAEKLGIRRIEANQGEGALFLLRNPTLMPNS
jgi:transcription-repair coupling factor (superfamily II helicase)